jgi:hypothetical protein
LFRGSKSSQAITNSGDLGEIPDSTSRLTPFKIPYLLRSGELVCTCLSDGRAKFLGHLGSLLVQIWAMVDLQIAATSYLSIQLFKFQIWRRILALIQNPWSFRQISNNESCSKTFIIPLRIFPGFSQPF